MGVAVSNWQLARAVSMRGFLGVVSSTGLDTVVARRLQTGDPDGSLRRAFDAFPDPHIASRVWDRYFVPGGKSPSAPFKSKPVFTLEPPKALIDLTVIANFAEVYLAKQGHDGQVGINLLEKIQLPTLASLFGAMLARVDYVLMGAGIPRQIPAILDQLSSMKEATLQIEVDGAGDAVYTMQLDPNQVGSFGPSLRRPLFLAIVSSAPLATTLVRKCVPPVDGFVIEGSTAGGHNAPPRGAMQFDSEGEPIYGQRDEPDIEAIKSLGKPFWLAGSWGSHGKLKEALALGANGIQVGTAFAFCDESGMDPKLRAEVIELARQGAVTVRTDALASPTGFPFKVVSLPKTLSEEEIFEERTRICDLGYLRKAYKRPDGKVAFRCPGEPVEDYISKGGGETDTKGRKCICNALMATIDLGQVRKGESEKPIITAGTDVKSIVKFLKPGKVSYSANDVLDRILFDVNEPLAP